jgi:ABC-type multidrug transport system fused ATPase/permease subunit
MSQPFEYYQQNKRKYKHQIDLLQKRIRLSGFIRISLFVLIVILTYFLVSNTRLFVPIFLLGIGLFTYLVLFHERLVYKKRLAQHLYDINSVEIEAIRGNLASISDGSEFIDPLHFYSNDIDLFGKGSFFHHINRTSTSSGKIALAQILMANDIKGIKERQMAIQELADLPEWRQGFMALSKMVSVEVKNETIVSWIKNYKPYLPGSMKTIPYVFSIISILIIFFTGLGISSFYALVLWFFLGLGITSPYLKRINRIYENAGKAKSTFKQYHKLLDEIENLSLQSEYLNRAQLKIETEQKKASIIFKEFSKILDALDQRNNMLFGILGNGLLLWDLHQSKKIEIWIEKYKAQAENWFEAIAFFDAHNSLANYAFNHPDYHYPTLNNSERILNAFSLGHPLIPKETRISNNFFIKDKNFLIITGANMAGKSTFLRTVSLTIVMGNIGLPVCAGKLEYHPTKLITSMRTSDSLVDDSSYFHAEIKRLKFIVDHIKEEEYFIILDEILKGTNSKDKAIGSRKFVERLVKSGSTGIIATHDLSLCDIEKEYDQIHNKYFDALIKDDELFFDYILKEGICVNMNASFLLKKMNII